MYIAMTLMIADHWNWFIFEKMIVVTYERSTKMFWKDVFMMKKASRLCSFIFSCIMLWAQRSKLHRSTRLNMMMSMSSLAAKKLFSMRLSSLTKNQNSFSTSHIICHVKNQISSCTASMCCCALRAIYVAKSLKMMLIAWATLTAKNV